MNRGACLADYLEGLSTLCPRAQPLGIVEPVGKVWVSPSLVRRRSCRLAVLSRCRKAGCYTAVPRSETCRTSVEKADKYAGKFRDLET